MTVRPSFLLIAALLGLTGAFDPVRIAIWIGIVFVSILVHELGHALLARSYGADVEIELNGLGGLTRWSIPADRLGPGRRAMVAAAGSAVGVLFGGAIWLVASRFGPYDSFSFFVISNLVYVNVFWGLLNWLPIRPLDGGHLLLSLLEKFAPDRGDSIARIVFVLTAAAGLVFGLITDRLFVVVIAAWLLFMEFGGDESARDIPAGPIPEYEEEPASQVPEEGEIVVEEADDDRRLPGG